MKKSTKPIAGAEDERLGKRIQKIRNAKGLTQIDLGHVAGTTYQQIQKYEKGKTRISAERLQRIMKALKVPWSYFFEDNSSKLFHFFEEKITDEKINQLWKDIADEDLRLSIFVLLKTLNSVGQNPAKPLE